MKRVVKFTIGFILILSAWLVVLDMQSYRYPDTDEIRQRLSYLQIAVGQPLEPGSDVWQLRAENPEFMLFSYAFSAYAVTNIAIRDTSFRAEAVDLVEQCIRQVLTDEVAAVFGVDTPLRFDTDSIPAYSVLYLGHLNLMLGCLRRLEPQPEWTPLHDAISRSLFDRYQNSKHLVLESYPSAIWIPDNAAAMASLNLHALATGSPYEEMCRRWADHCRKHYLESQTGVLYSTVNPSSGAPSEEPRGSMLGWSILFIGQFDHNFAKSLYAKYKENFSSNYLIFRLFKERHDQSGTQIGDIDSGPVFKGYSIPANAFAFGAAILAGDFRTALKAERLIRLGSRKIQTEDGIRHRVRFVNMHISPMAEAIVLFSMTYTRW